MSEAAISGNCGLSGTILCRNFLEEIVAEVTEVQCSNNKTSTIGMLHTGLAYSSFWSKDIGDFLIACNSSSQSIMCMFLHQFAELWLVTVWLEVTIL